MADEDAHHFPKFRKKSGKTPESNKKRRRTQIKLIQQSRIYIGSHKKRWSFLKKRLGLKKDRDLAAHLMSCQ